VVPLVLVAASRGLAACSRSQGASPQGAGSGAPGARGIRVRVAPVAIQDVVYEIKAVGSLEAEEMVQVTAEVEGAISDVLFHEGDRVAPSTVLARIDPERYKVEAQRAEANYRKAQADAQRAAADLVRRESLAAEKLVAVEELNRARGENERLTAEAASAQAAWAIALQNLRRSEVRPSRGGMINSRTVETGTFVRTGTVLATLADLSRLRLRFKVSEAESLRAQVGQEVGFKVQALGNAVFTARIYHVSGVADPATRQVEVLAWVKNPGVLKPGFFAEVALATESRKDAMVVAESAVQASERGFVAYVVESGKAKLTPVAIGLRTGTGLVEILSGLKPGQTVVVEGSDRVADGVPVQPVTEGRPSAGAPSGSPAAAAGATQ
jgi:multidrug efflux system membrane fusion protein